MLIILVYFLFIFYLKLIEKKEKKIGKYRDFHKYFSHTFSHFHISHTKILLTERITSAKVITKVQLRQKCSVM